MHHFPNHWSMQIFLTSGTGPNILISTVQSNCTIFSQECFEIPLYMFISIIKTTSAHEGNFEGMKKLEMVAHNFFCMLCLLRL